MTETMINYDQPREDMVNHLARDVLKLETLEPRNMDRLDFHELPVQTIKYALELAYEAGRWRGSRNATQGD